MFLDIKKMKLLNKEKKINNTGNMILYHVYYISEFILLF